MKYPSACKKSNHPEMIPPLIVLKAADDRHVLVSLSLHDSLHVEANVVENSKYLFRNAEWRSDGLEGQPMNYVFRRVSSRSAPKTYTSTLCKTNCYLNVSWHEPIYIYTMTYSGVVLPSTYFRVFRGDDVTEKWHFKKPVSLSSVSLSSVSPSSVSPSSVSLPAKIPSHIVRGFVESAIHKKEVCPITLEAFVMGHVAMTSCGHLFNKEALIRMLESNTACPNCRCNIDSDLVFL